MIKLVLSFVILVSFAIDAKQLGDTNFQPKNTSKTFSKAEVPLVLLDEAHHNFHTMDGRYKPFASILASDGYLVQKNKQPFTLESLKRADILVISNALSGKNVRNWNLPNYSAFAKEEVEAVRLWVKNGGSLFLIADHMPFPKAAESMATAFGFQFNNGYAKEPSNTG